MRQEQNHNPEIALEDLWARYREACGEPEGNANFLPEIWQKIDRRKNRFQSFQRVAKVFVTAAATLSLVFGALLMVGSVEQSHRLNSETYIEVLSAGNSPDIEPVRLEAVSLGSPDRR